MRKKAWLFLGCLMLFSAAGALLRALELRTALDTSTMLMDTVPASILLLVLSAVVLVFMGLLARGLEAKALPRRYGRCFGGAGTLAVAALCLLLTFWGALLCLRDRGGTQAQRLLPGLLALMSALAGTAWLALGLDVRRKKKADSFLSAAIPVFFCGLFLVIFYKTYAQIPALLYTLYPFLGLCGALAGLHLIAGFTVNRERARPRLTLFFCGAGAYFCAVALAGAPKDAYRLFFAALALELAVHGVYLLLPHEPDPEEETEEKEETPEGDGEMPAGGEEAAMEAAPEAAAETEAPAAEKEETPEGDGEMPAGGEEAATEAAPEAEAPAEEMDE